MKYLTSIVDTNIYSYLSNELTKIHRQIRKQNFLSNDFFFEVIANPTYIMIYSIKKIVESLNIDLMKSDDLFH